MVTLLRGLLAGLLVIGLAALGAIPDVARAQDKGKKEPPKDPTKSKEPAKTPVPGKTVAGTDDVRDKSVGFGTSDGLALNGYFFQGVGIDKQRPDAVMMFPAPGGKVTDAWISLAQDLSKKNFSVLLFDWRGAGKNAPETAGSRIIEDKEKFWADPYNKQILYSSRNQIEDKGLDYQRIVVRTQGTYRYRDFMLNDLVAARYFLDKQNDNGKCNTNRVWIVTEKDGGPLALSFIASEFLRNSMYETKNNVFDAGRQFKASGKDYVGLTTLSYTTGGSNGGTATAVFRNAFSIMNAQTQREAKDHLERRLAMVMVYGKKEGQSGSKSAFGQAGAGGSEDDLRKNFKYLREIDNSKPNKVIAGIDLVDPMDSFGAKAEIVKVMVEVAKDKQNFNKDATDRDANKVTYVPRFQAEALGKR
jgi:hypothetical protein